MFELEKELCLPLILCRLFSSQSYESSLEVWVEFLIDSILEGYLLETPINRVGEDDTLITLSDAYRIPHAKSIILSGLPIPEVKILDCDPNLKAHSDMYDSSCIVVNLEDVLSLFDSDTVA